MREFKASLLPESSPTDGKVELLDIHFDLHNLAVIVGLYDEEIDKKLTWTRESTPSFFSGNVNFYRECLIIKKKLGIRENITC